MQPEYNPITTDQRKKVLGLNAAALYDIPVPEHLQVAQAPDQVPVASPAPAQSVPVA